MESSISRSQPATAGGTTWGEHAAHIREVAGSFSASVLILPAILCAWIGTQTEHPLWQYTTKRYQEILGPAILGVALFVALIIWAVRRDFYFRWWAILSACLLCREFHFTGTGTAIYFAVPLMFWYASANFEAMKPYVNNRWLVSLFVGAFVVYFFTITVDRAVWKFLPNHAHWRNSVEETLESVGHFMLLAALIGSALIPRRSPKNTAA